MKEETPKISLDQLQQMDVLAAQAYETVLSFLTAWGLQVVGAIFLFFIGRMVARGMRSATGAALTRANVDASLVPFLSSLVYYFALTVVIVAVLNLFGVETTSIVAVLGAAGLAVGLALQGTLSNFAAGVMILIFRPFRAGDYVEAGGTAGTVKEISIFSSTLSTPDNVRIIVPNSKIFGDTIKNFSANDTRRVDLVVGISYEDNIGTAVETINSVLSAEERVLAEPEAVVAVAELGDSSVNIVVRPWCNKADYWSVKFDLTRALKEKLEEAGCSIPFPQRDLHIISGDAGAMQKAANA